MSSPLARLGWRASLQAHIDALGDPALAPARVLAQDRGRVVLDDGGRSWPAALSGALRHAAASCDGAEALPTVGDWVAAAPLGPVRAVLPRAGVIARATDTGRQVLAANVDLALIATSLNRDLSPGRVDRFLAVAAAGGVEAVVLATKADLPDDPDVAVASLRAGVRDVPVLVVSALDGRGLDSVRALLAPGRAAVLLGSSGVGKSTLRNALMGDGAAATAPVRDSDDRGRHTTVRRELATLPGGALLIDTPGLRLVGVDGGLEGAFADVETLAAQCRFANCSHRDEPGCAVRAAVEAGEIDARRLRSRERLSREASRRQTKAYNTLQRSRRRR